MTEQEAANRLCELLNEVEEAGIAVMLQPDHLLIGEGSVHIVEPPCEGEPWEVRES
jgi:hypothetical protein